MMETFETFLANEAARAKTYDFSSTQINLPDELATKVKSWCRKNIPDKDLFKSDADKSFGRENDPHVTILYGIHTAKPLRVKKLLKNVEPLVINLGKISLFKNETFDVLKIEIKSPGLITLNKILSENLYATQNFPEYKPHATIAYLAKNHGDKWNNNKDFSGEEFEAKEIIFSSWQGEKTKIKLNVL